MEQVDAVTERPDIDEPRPPRQVPDVAVLGDDGGGDQQCDAGDDQGDGELAALRIERPRRDHQQQSNGGRAWTGDTTRYCIVAPRPMQHLREDEPAADGREHDQRIAEYVRVTGDDHEHQRAGGQRTGDHHRRATVADALDPRPDEIELLLVGQRPCKQENDAAVVEVHEHIAGERREIRQVLEKIRPRDEVRLRQGDQDDVEGEHRLVQWQQAERAAAIETEHRNGARVVHPAQQQRANRKTADHEEHQHVV